jgi:thymidylate kinase
MLGIKFQKPDIVFFLKVAPDVAVNRVVKRGKKRQVHETKIFLSKLQEVYQLVCKILGEDTKIYTIDTDEKTIKQLIDIVVEKIR